MDVNWKVYTLFVMCASIVFTDAMTNKDYVHDSDKSRDLSNKISSDFKIYSEMKYFKPKSVSVYRKRWKRSVINYNHCPIGYTWYIIKCIPCKTYEQVTGEPCEQN